MDATTTTVATGIPGYVTGLAPAFIAGFGVQQAVEIIDSLLSWRDHWDPGNSADVRKKKALLSCVSFLIAAALVTFGGGQIDVLKPFLGDNYQWGLLGGVVTVIFISGGTEGFNSLMKWVSYKKEDAKANAAKSKGAGLKAMPS